MKLSTQAKDERKKSLVVDQTVNLSCGCVITYMRGDLDRGQMFLCKKHIREDPFDSVRVVNQIALAIRSGATRFELEGR